jgi:hypothetical protein
VDRVHLDADDDLRAEGMVLVELFVDDITNGGRLSHEGEFSLRGYGWV